LKYIALRSSPELPQNGQDIFFEEAESSDTLPPQEGQSNSILLDEESLFEKYGFSIPA